MEHALSTVQPGELLLLQADEVDESVDFIRRYLANCIQAHEVSLDQVPAQEAPATPAPAKVPAAASQSAAVLS
jgi:hypothetical protein